MVVRNVILRCLRMLCEDPHGDLPGTYKTYFKDLIITLFDLSCSL
jgi:hypothetical protein